MRNFKYRNLFILLFASIIISYIILNSTVFYLGYKFNERKNIDQANFAQKTQEKMMQNALLSIKNSYSKDKNTSKILQNIKQNIPFLSQELWLVKIIETGNRLSLEVLFSNFDKNLENQKLASTKTLSLSLDDLENLMKNAVLKKQINLSENQIKLQNWHKLDENLLLGINQNIKAENVNINQNLFKQTFKNLKNVILVSTIFVLFCIIILYLFMMYISKKLQRYERDIEFANAQLAKRNKELEETLFIDLITNLPNKISMDTHIESMQTPRLIVFCVDDFRRLANYYGSDSGNFVLQELSKQLQNFAKENSLKLYKIDLDLFAFLENSTLDIDRYEYLAEELIKNFKGISFECPFSNSSIEISCTIAFCLEPDDTLRKAMIALNEAKTKERDYIGYFKKIDSTKEYADYLSWSNFIKDALKKDSVIPFYQPIYDINGKIAHYECLVRILDNNQEAVAPGLFLATSKKVKLYSQIIKSLIDKSFKQISNTDKIISINMLARDMTDSDVSNYVVKKIMQYDIANQIIFEILEDESIDKIDRIKTFINKVKRMGVKIAIDDFGTGYSNFVYMLELKPDFLKIDGSLIKKIDIDTNAYAVVNAIVVFAKELGIQTTAEFIHSKEVYETCLELGITQFQGFYLGEPRPSF